MLLYINVFVGSYVKRAPLFSCKAWIAYIKQNDASRLGSDKPGSGLSKLAILDTTDNSSLALVDDVLTGMRIRGKSGAQFRVPMFIRNLSKVLPLMPYQNSFDDQQYLVAGFCFVLVFGRRLNSLFGSCLGF